MRGSGASGTAPDRALWLGRAQASLAFIYQGTYFLVCIYVGVILVRAYKVPWILDS